MSDPAGDDDCVFCRIVAGELPATIVRRDQHTIAFRDLHPQAPVHVLVIPIEHVEHAGALHHGHGELLTHLFVAAQQVAADEGVAESGYRLVFNVGPDALNSVPHLHLHVLGGRAFTWPPG